jgi:chemotaxis regulatin CheY-phosphate phosphatase CheZ
MSGANTLKSKLQEEILSLADAIREIVDKYKELRNPLVESHEKVPQATQQLDKISEQTEAATHQMLDLTEKISQYSEEIVTGLTTIKEKAASGDVDGVNELADGLMEKATTTGNDAFTIMDALQFQDITSQQMNHAASLMEEIETKLHQIIHYVQGSQAEEEPATVETQSERKRVFDPHAEFSDKKTDQAEVDNLFKNAK